MTQHVLPQDTLEDQKTMRRLFTVIGGFVAATALMAITIGIVMN